MKKIVTSVISLVLAAVIVIACGVGSAWFTNWNVTTWFNSWGRGSAQPDNSGDTGDNKNPDDKDPETTAEYGSAEITSGESHGIELTNVKLPVMAYAANEISPQADTAHILTATADVSDVVYEWSAAWANANSAWANGKNVSDYVTVTATSSGAATARAVCNQAFGEPVTITVKVKDTELSATCTADYVQKFVGRDFKLSYSNTISYAWNFSYTNTNPTVDIPSSTDSMSWLIGLGDSDNTSIGGDVHLSAAYTKPKEGNYIKEYNFCVTQDYINALKAAGLTPKVQAEEVISISQSPATTFYEIFFGKVAGALPASATNWNAFRTSLRNNSDKVMFRVKSFVSFGVNNTYSTTYNVKFNTSSLTAVATNVTLDPDGIEF